MQNSTERFIESTFISSSYFNFLNNSYNSLNYNNTTTTNHNNNSNLSLNFSMANQNFNAPKPFLWNYQNRCQSFNPIMPMTVYYNKPSLLYQQAMTMQRIQQHQQRCNQMQFSNFQYLPFRPHASYQAQPMLLNANYSYQWSNCVETPEYQFEYKYNWQCQLQFRIREILERPMHQLQFAQVLEDTLNTSNGETSENNISKSFNDNFNENSNTSTKSISDSKKFKPFDKFKKIKKNRKGGTVQRNGSKVSHHHRKTCKDQQQTHHQALAKNVSSDSSTSINVNRQQNHRQHPNQNRQHDRNNSKQRKTRCPTKQRQDGQQRAVSKRSSDYSMDDWLENGEMVYYERRRFISSSDEDKKGDRHSAAHRNSTSSEASPSEDLTTSSSNEDLQEAAYAVESKCNKNIPKSRNRRQQQKRKKQTSESGNSNQDDNEDAMDIDTNGTVKENCRPNKNSFQSRNGFKNANQDRNKSLAQKNTQHGNKNAGKTLNVLKNSNLNSGGKRASSSSSTSSSTTMTKTPITSQLSSPLIGGSSVESSPTASPTTCKRNAENIKKIALQLAPPSRAHINTNYTETELIEHLKRYIIDPNLLRVYGFPVESAIHDGCIEIYKCLPKPQDPTDHQQLHHHHHRNHHNTPQHQVQQSFCFTASSSVINANDGLYVNALGSFKDDWAVLDDVSSSSTDSGQGSGDSSPPSVDSDTSEGVEDETSVTTALYTPDGSYQIFSQYDQSLEKQCVRCKRAFHVTEVGEYLNREPCTYHWGKLNNIYAGYKGYCFQYTCCHGDHESQGCVNNELHVWTGAVVGLNGPYTDFVHTKSRYDCSSSSSSSSSTGPTKVYALDCEMSFTGRGLEVTKITVIGYDGQIVYEHFVRPDAEIVDYNTRFSGITENDLNPNSNRSVKTLAEVQHDLLRFIDADTIIIGHGIDNDLRVLRIVHKTIIDTSICFPHTSGFPYRRALKHLTKVYLNRDIQTGHAGHSSYEDSRASLDLMLWKVHLSALKAAS